MATNISAKTKRALHDLGLTSYESRAYQYLMQSGPSPAAQICKATGLPYSKIYNILTSLEQKGWVEMESGRPKRYYPKSPSEALEATRLRLNHTLDDNIAQILGELQPLYNKNEVRETPDIWIIRGEFNILARIGEMLNETKRELMIAAARLPEMLFDLFLPELDRLNRLNVSLKLMVTRDTRDDVVAQLKNYGDVSVKNQMFGNGIISDSRSVMLIVGTDPDLVAICSDHLGLVGLSKEYFDYMWADTLSASEGSRLKE
ncbi:MAG: winged helix DNA-binding protein [Candidatus Bathyarchaeota archaeon]|nr:winged helix DNA-binding protein [Candidatus Bathyarchaeota archaeon]